MREMLAADAGTWALVIVTGALAIFTAAMAWFTRKAVEAGKRTADAAEQDIRQGADLVKIGQDQVREAQRQVDLASRALEAERQPVVIATTERESYDKDAFPLHHCHGLVVGGIQDFSVAKCVIDQRTGWVVVKVRNVGRGSAFIEDMNTDAVIDLDGNGQLFGEPYSAVIAPDDRMFIAFAGQPNGPDLNTLHTWVQTSRPFTVSIRYSDVTRTRSFITNIAYGSNRPDANVLSVAVEEVEAAS